MEYMGFIFGIFGLLAYLQIAPLKSRVSELERQLTKTKGTAFHKDRRALVQAARSYIGQKVTIDLKEDDQDVDIIMYGNTKNGSNTILDADEEWLLVRIDSKKGSKEKLIRMESLEGISVIRE